METSNIATMHSQALPQSIFSKAMLRALGWTIAILFVPGIIGGILWQGLAAFGLWPALTELVSLSLISIITLPLSIYFLVSATKATTIRQAAEWYSFKFCKHSMLALVVLSATVYALFTHFGFIWLDIPEETFMKELYSQLNSPVAIIIVATSMCVCAPIVEESVFRGYLYRHFENTALGQIGAIVIPSILFSLIHFQYESGMSFLALLTGGLILGSIRAKTQNLSYAVAFHSVINAFVIVEHFL